MEKSAPSIEELQAQMQAKIKAIPTPKLDKKKLKKVQERVHQQDKKNLQHTMKILQERREEAIKSGDRKKKYASIAVERSERDQFNIREKIRELQVKIDALKKVFDEETWNLLETFSELKNPKYWEKAKKNGGFSEQEIAFYYRDVWGLNPKMVVKFLEILKYRHEIMDLEKLL